MAINPLSMTQTFWEASLAYKRRGVQDAALTVSEFFLVLRPLSDQPFAGGALSRQATMLAEEIVGGKRRRPKVAGRSKIVYIATYTPKLQNAGQTIQTAQKLKAYG